MAMLAASMPGCMVRVRPQSKQDELKFAGHLPGPGSHEELIRWQAPAHWM